MNLDTKVIIPETLLIQEVDDEIILLDTNTQEYFTLSEVGKVIFEELKISKNLKDIHTNLLELYEVSSEQLEKDLMNFVSSLAEKKLIFLEY